MLMATALWNDMAKRVADAVGRETIVPAIRPNAARRRLIELRLKDVGGLDAWEALMRQIETSDFLTGRSARGPGHESWRPSLGWIVEARNWSKLREGAYFGKAGAPTARFRSMGDVSREWLASDAEPEHEEITHGE